MITKLKNIKRKLHLRFTKPILYKQELLFRLALKEKGFEVKKLEISCNHDKGTNNVNGLVFGIKYPDSFFYKAQNLIPKVKEYDFYFNGNMDKNGQRTRMLSPFNKYPKSYIIESNEGRVQNNKDKFNTYYFSELAKSKYGLCPHQKDWPGSKEYMWTYRFIESCFVGAIPVLFREAPLGNVFTKGFFYLWDDDIIGNNSYNIYETRLDLIQSNMMLAQKRFCLSTEDKNLIAQSL